MAVERSGPAVSACPGQTRPPPPSLARPLVLTQPLSLVWFLDILNAGFLLKDLGSLGIFLHLLGNMGPSLPVLAGGGHAPLYLPWKEPAEILSVVGFGRANASFVF